MQKYNVVKQPYYYYCNHFLATHIIKDFTVISSNALQFFACNDILQPLSLHIFTVPVFCIVLEKVVLQRIANAHKHIGRNVLAFEKSVDVLPGIEQFAGKPRHGALLPCKFGLYQVSDMWFFGRCHLALL